MLSPDFATSDAYVTFVGPLPRSEAECLPALPRKARAAARHAIRRYHLRAAFGREHLGTIHRLYAGNVRRLGSPVYPRRFFEALADLFGDRCVCQVVLMPPQDGRPPAVAGLISFVFKDRMMPYYSGSLLAYRRCNPNNFLYLKAMEYGVAHGCRVFDFGRTRRENSGSYQFKVNQGFAPQPLPYQFLLLGADRARRVDPGQDEFRLAQAVWRRLPLPVTKWVGGVITRSIP